MVFLFSQHGGVAGQRRQDTLLQPKRGHDAHSTYKWGASGCVDALGLGWLIRPSLLSSEMLSLGHQQVSERKKWGEMGRNNGHGPDHQSLSPEVPSPPSDVYLYTTSSDDLKRMVKCLWEDFGICYMTCMHVPTYITCTYTHAHSCAHVLTCVCTCVLTFLY